MNYRLGTNPLFVGIEEPFIDDQEDYHRLQTIYGDN